MTISAIGTVHLVAEIGGRRKHAGFRVIELAQALKKGVDRPVDPETGIRERPRVSQQDEVRTNRVLVTTSACGYRSDAQETSKTEQRFCDRKIARD
jgi:hypothetical protein